MPNFKVIITFQTAKNAEDDAEFVVDVEADSREQACDLAAKKVRAEHSIEPSTYWHCSTELIPPEI